MRVITNANRGTSSVLPDCDPGETPMHDLHGYEIAYYVGTLAGGRDCRDPLIVDGEVALRDMSGDVLCGGCAADPDLLADDEGLYVAYQSMGEIGNEEPEVCSHCGGTIYEPDPA